MEGTPRSFNIPATMFKSLPPALRSRFKFIVLGGVLCAYVCGSCFACMCVCVYVCLFVSLHLISSIQRTASCSFPSSSLPPPSDSPYLPSPPPFLHALSWSSARGQGLLTSRVKSAEAAISGGLSYLFGLMTGLMSCDAVREPVERDLSAFNHMRRLGEYG